MVCSADEKHPLQPDTAEVFESNRRELARDLVAKVRQIESLADTLPGHGRSEQDQEADIAALQKQLLELAEKRQAVDARRDTLVDSLQKTIIEYVPSITHTRSDVYKDGILTDMTTGMAPSSVVPVHEVDFTSTTPQI